jgi:hypothetical protein
LGTEGSSRQFNPKSTIGIHQSKGLRVRDKKVKALARVLDFLP